MATLEKFARNYLQSVEHSQAISKLAQENHAMLKDLLLPGMKDGELFLIDIDGKKVGLVAHTFERPGTPYRDILVYEVTS